MAAAVLSAIFITLPHMAWAAAKTESMELDQPGDDDSSTETLAPDQERLETIHIIDPGPPRARDRLTQIDYFFPYRTSMSPRIGLVFDSEETAKDSRWLYALGIQYLFTTHDLRSYEVGLDLISNGTGVLQGTRRWIFSRSRFRPFAKAGAAVHLKPEQALATFLELENYQVLASAGFENLVAHPLSLRCDFELTVSAAGTYRLMAFAGYSWAW